MKEINITNRDTKDNSKSEVLEHQSVSNNKLNKQEYIVRAAKLYGLGEVEIAALNAHLSGKSPNEYIERRCDYLFRLYDIYRSKEYNEHLNPDERGIINLNDFCFEKSKRRLADSKIGIYWILSSNLDIYLATVPPNRRTEIRNKFIGISEKNNFLLPQIARQMGLDATVYYKGKYTERNGTFSTHHLTKNFLYDEETLIQGNSIVKDNPKRKRINFELLLETTDRYIKKYYKKNKLPEEDSERVREEIRKGLIKQTLFNKLVFNENESNSKWGLIIGKDKNLRLAPIFSYDYSAGVEPTGKVHHRAIQGSREDIASFMLQYSKEKWFREWIDKKVLTLDLDRAISDMTRITGVELNDEETKYYKFLIEKMKAKVTEVCDLDYDRELVEKTKKEKLGSKILRVKDTISDKLVDLTAFVKSVRKADDRDL